MEYHGLEELNQLPISSYCNRYFKDLDVAIVIFVLAFDNNLSFTKSLSQPRSLNAKKIHFFVPGFHIAVRCRKVASGSLLTSSICHAMGTAVDD